jgi:hypothetical protein
LKKPGLSPSKGRLNNSGANESSDAGGILKTKSPDKRGPSSIKEGAL